MSIHVKIHESSLRKVIAICDSELLGKRFEQGKMQLEVKPSFYNGVQMTYREILMLIKAEREASFNIVGKEAVKLCISAKLLSEENIIQINGIPHAMVF